MSIDNSMASQYGIVIFDTENHQIEEYLYTWDYAIPIFREREISKKTPLNIKSSIFNNNKDFINEFYRDKLGLCDNFLEYYVFPNVYYKYPDEENIKSVISEDLFFTELSDKKIIEVHADRKIPDGGGAGAQSIGKRVGTHHGAAGSGCGRGGHAPGIPAGAAADDHRVH